MGSVSKLHLGGFKWVEETCHFNEYFLRSYNEDSHIGYFIEVDVQYLENLDNLQNDLPFLPERMKIWKAEKLTTTNLHNRKENAMHMKILKQALIMSKIAWSH